MEHPEALLTLKESPWGSDYSLAHDSLVVGTAGGFAFYPIQEAGTPRQLIFYDFYQTGNILKVQPGQKPVIATALGSQVLMFDPSHFVSPLTLMVENHSPVKDICWSPHKEGIFSTVSTSGVVSLWDSRAASKPTHELLLGRQTTRLQFNPSNPHLLSVCAEDRFVVVWDIRKMPSAAPSANGGEAPSDFTNCYALLEVDDVVVDYCWGSYDYGSALHILDERRSIGTWCLHSSIAGAPVSKLVDEYSCDVADFSTLMLSSPRERAPGASSHFVLYKVEAGNKSEPFSSKFYEVHLSEDVGRRRHDRIGAMKNRVLGCFWRYTQTTSTVLALSDNGMLHALPLHPLSETRYTADDINTEDGTSMVNSEKDNLFVAAELERAMRRKKHGNPSLKSTLGGHESIDARIFDPRSIRSKLSPVDKSAVVGPVTFMALVQDELHALESSLNFRTLEGLRVESVDQFYRQIVLELLIPRRDKFLISMKNKKSLFENYYEHMETEAFHLLPMGQQSPRTVVLTIAFPVKVVNFWNLKLSIENRSIAALDEESLSKIVTAMTKFVKTKPPIKPITSTPGGHRLGSVRVDAEQSLLYQLAKFFRKRVFRVWEKAIEDDGTATAGRSFSSFKQSLEMAISFATDSDIGKDDYESRYLQCVESKAFRVPFPILSAGVFNPLGQLTLFGSAQIQLADDRRESETVVQNRSTVVDRLPPKLANILNGAKGEDVRHVPSQSAAGHKSYAQKLCVDFIKRAVSESKLSTRSDNRKRTGSYSLGAEPHVPDTIHEEYKSKSRDDYDDGDNDNNNDDDDDDDDDEDEDDEDGDEDGDEDHDEDESESLSLGGGAAHRKFARSEDDGHHLDMDGADDGDDDQATDEDEDGDQECEADEQSTCESQRSGGDHEGSRPLFNMEIDEDHPASPTRKKRRSETRLKRTHSPLSSPYGSPTTRYRKGLINARQRGLSIDRSETAISTAPPFLQPPTEGSSPDMTMSDSLHSSSYYIGEDPGSRVESRAASMQAQGLSENENENESCTNELTVLPSLCRKLVHLSELYQLGPLYPLQDRTMDLQQRVAACRTNTGVVERHIPENRALAQIWSLLAVSLDVLSFADNGGYINWSSSTLGSATFSKVVAYLAMYNDLQTWAVVICVIGGSRTLTNLLQPGVCEQLIAGTSNGSDLAELVVDALDQKLYSYGQILLRRGDLIRANEVFKRMESVELHSHRLFDLCEPEQSQLSVRYLKQDKSSPDSLNESQGEDYWEARVQPQCALCLLPMTGLFVLCEICGHGGHAEHLSRWFEQYEECPTGCTCRCRSTLRSQDVEFEDDDEEYPFDYAALDSDPPLNLSMDFATNIHSHPYFDGYHTGQMENYGSHAAPSYLQEISLERNYMSRYNYNQDLVGIHHRLDRDKDNMRSANR